ncbi:MAG: hypothetical protein C9356_12040 [Oleiphilus sp.]|nr:MAG: hypothetical protein C9356_12040 [Oleiphilus sp.]
MSKQYQPSDVKWGEFIAVLIGGYSVSMTEDKQGNPMPFLYDTKTEVESEIQDAIDAYNEQIAEGDRDADDEYEGEAFPCVVEGDEIVLLCEHSLEELERINWREGR